MLYYCRSVANTCNMIQFCFQHRSHPPVPDHTCNSCYPCGVVARKSWGFCLGFGVSLQKEKKKGLTLAAVSDKSYFSSFSQQNWS